MILITGATGSNGTEIIKLLSSRSVRLRAMVRKPEAAKEIARLPGVELLVADFDDPASLERALSGVERAFLLTNSTEKAEVQQSSFVDAAKTAGIEHIVKLSQFAADEKSPVRFLRYHAAVERRIRESGMAYTFLRPNLFMQGLLNFSKPIREENQFYAAAGNAKVSVVDVRDIAASAVAALTGPGHENRIHTLTGPEALSHAEMAGKLSKAIGRPIAYVEVLPDAMRASLLAFGMPPWQADGLLEDYAHYRRGEAAVVESGVKSATGEEPRSFDGFARDYAPEFS